MKKGMLVSIVISLVLFLTACGSSATSTATATADAALSLEGQLLVGTLKLESTDLAVTSTQAQQLLPLWETLQSLASSSTAASQEVDAVVSQIESTMSPEQISSITAMTLTKKDLAAAVLEMGVSSTNATQASASNSTRSQAGGPLGGVDMGGGNPPADMSGGAVAMAAGSSGQTGIGTTQAAAGQSAASSNQVPPALINALVELLKTKAA
jgi:hypothetical protein